MRSLNPGLIIGKEKFDALQYPALQARRTSASTLLAPAEPRVRTFSTFSQPLAELIDARIWAGLHYRHGDVQGQLLGVNVANYAAVNFFQAVGH